MHGIAANAIAALEAMCAKEGAELFIPPLALCTDNAAMAALAVEKHRDAAAITFLITLSGVTLAGIGAPFWGVVAGAVALGVQHFRSAAPPAR